MGEWLLELLLAIAEPLLEAFLELAAAAVLDLISRAITTVLEDSGISGPVLSFFGYGVLGLLSGRV
ncbi:MAG TPA: hypothetical protein VFE61_29695 [Candidatus Sulfotelmatobacter sp.]|nr:hypothetical protein [Candidatus Sulfotelmatobacter sp.]